MRRTTGPVCAVLLAVFVATLALSAPAFGQALEVPAGCKSEGGAALLADFLVTDDEPTALLKALQRDGAQVEFLLATVPAPRLGFDGVIESLAHALEAADHTLDRYTLPWTQHPEKGAALCQEYVPGVALFVRSPERSESGHGPRRLLLVYLIGESPTAGVHRLAFLRAVHEMATLRAQLPPDRCQSCGSVRLLGPSFSGAVASLEQLLEHPAVRDLPFTILSGRATDAAIRPLLERHGRPERPISYRATVIPDEALQTEFFCYLTETLGADDHDIALLTESSTVFGQAAAQPSGAETQPASPQPQKSARCQQPHRPRLTLPVPLHISRLNAAWAARQQAMQKGAEKQDVASGLDSGAGRALPKAASLDNSERTDVIPILSPGTVVATDRALATILTTIAAEKVRYVGLVFTDEQDTLFLTEQVRKFCPDVVLFTFENNILFTHPDARPLLKGMLSVSTYPLFTRNQQWSYPFRGYTHRLQFARDADQGVYNAAVALLGRPELLIEYSQPISRDDPLPQRRPPIWVNAVGIEAMIPLTFLTDYKDRGYVYENPVAAPAQHLYAPYLQGTLSMLLLLLGVVGVLLSVGYFRCYYASPEAELGPPWTLLRLFRRSTAFHPRSSIGRHEAERQPLFTLAIFLPMALLYPFFTAIHFVQLRDGNTGLEAGTQLSDLPLWLRLLHKSGSIGIYESLTWRVLAIGMCAAACQLVFLVVSGDLLLLCCKRGQRLRRFLSQSFRRRPRMVAAALAMLFVLGTAALFRTYVLAINLLQRDFNNLVFMRRAAQPAFGLSPLTPLLILVSGLQLWGYCNLQRIRLLEKLATVFLDFIEEIEHQMRLRAQLETIARQLESPSLWQLGTAVLAAILLVMSVFADVVSLEGYWLNLIFRLLLALLCVCVSYAVYRFLRLWLHFSRFLDLVAQHPLAHALERMPETLARSIGSLFLEELPEHARYDAEQGHVRLLSNQLLQFDLEQELGKLPPSQAETLRTLFSELKNLFQNRSEEPGMPGAASTGAERPTIPTEWDEPRLLVVSKLLAQILKTFWRGRPLPGTLPDVGSVPLNHSTAAVYARALPAGLALWLRLAEDFIAIQVVAYIHRLFPLLRNGMIFFTGALLLMLAAMVIYPFQPQHFLGLLLWALMLAGIALTVLVFVQMSRDETLSRIAKTEPGKVSFDRRFVSQLIVYGVLPLLSLLAAQFPEVRGFAFSWFETILKTLK